MRLSCSLLLLALGAPIALGQACPKPDPSVTCNARYVRVKTCFCLAKMYSTFSLPALFDATSYDPVTCNGCSYDNECLAIAAGESKCEQACADPAPGVVCTAEFAPVACGGYVWCIYDNLCLAMAAGKTQADCQRSCPELSGEVVCTQVSPGERSW